MGQRIRASRAAGQQTISRKRKRMIFMEIPNLS
jgi:hypothetical protein